MVSSGSKARRPVRVPYKNDLPLTICFVCFVPAEYGKSQFDVILAQVATGNSTLVTLLVKLLKPKGKCVFRDDSAASVEQARSNLLLAGFINIVASESNGT